MNSKVKINAQYSSVFNVPQANSKLLKQLHHNKE